MLKLRLIERSDLSTIQNWPAYPPEFAELDYALRENGWLAEFHGKPNASIYISEQNLEIVAFSILAKTAPAEAEFRIAVHPDKVGHGIGKTATLMTLQEGFSKICLSRIHLIVRMNNSRAINLYKQLGFSECGYCIKIVNRNAVHFLMMDLKMKNTADAGNYCLCNFSQAC